MLRAVFVRTLKPGVTYEQFKEAWVPEGLKGDYPAKARLARNQANDRQVITILELDVTASEFKTASAFADATRCDSSGSGRSSRRPNWRVFTKMSSTRRRCRDDDRSSTGNWPTRGRDGGMVGFLKQVVFSIPRSRRSDSDSARLKSRRSWHFHPRASITRRRRFRAARIRFVSAQTKASACTSSAAAKCTAS